MAIGITHGGEIILTIDKYDQDFTVKISKEELKIIKSSGSGISYKPNTEVEHLIRVVFK